MAINYSFQTASDLTTVSQTLVQSATLDDPIFKIFPIRQRNSTRLRWSIKDNYKGLMKLRGLGGEPTPIARVGTNVYEDNAGVYGQYGTIDEIELTNRAAALAMAGLGDNAVIPLNDLVSESQAQLTVAQVQRMKQICWTLALTGTFSVTLPTGGVGHTGSYTAQTVTVSPLWSTTATATPLKNFRDLQPAFGFGTSTLFNGMATAWMNSATLNYALSNTNAADFGGRRIGVGGTVNGIAGLNQLMLEQGTPQIQIWDDGYIDDSGTFQLYIPTGKILVVGKRPDGETPGEFQMTINRVNNSSQPYSKVDTHQGVPPRFDVHMGFNGGPVVERGTQMVVMTVG